MISLKPTSAWISVAALAALLGFVGVRHARAQYMQQYPQQYGSRPYGQAPSGSALNGPGPNSPSQAETDAGAARVSYIYGDVSLQRGDTGETSVVTQNTPLVAGDKISTGDTSNAEVQLDYANILRLSERAQANITALSRAVIQIQLAQGLASYSLLKGSEASVEIDTPNVAVRPVRDGRYRIFVTSDGQTEVTVREGEAEISTPQGNTRVRKGDLITILGSGNDTQYKVMRASAADEFDSWNKDRDDLILRAPSRERTNPYYTGTQDLDPYGTWSEVPDYGSVWVPTVAVDWAPYRVGRWVWEPYWGWTWVSQEPWGWAPYHYGRWLMYGGRWAWWPGPVYAGYRPVWAPAYVSFFGFGSGGFGASFGFGFGFGSIGWLPIGPCDYFHPWWGGYRDRYTVARFGEFNRRDGIGPLHGGDRFSNLRDVTSNDRLRGGVSSVAAGSFGRGSVAARGVSASDLRGARMMTGNVPIAPSRESLRVSDRPANPSAFSGRAASQQRFFSTRQAGAAVQPFGGTGRGQQPVAEGRQSFSPQNSQPPSGWRRFSSNPNPAGNARVDPRSARPPLDMSKPIVNQRGDDSRFGFSGGYRGNPPSYRPPPPRYNGGAPAYRPTPPSYSGGAPGYRPSAPSYGGGGAPAPAYRPSAPSYGGGAPSYRPSAPSYGGGGPGYRGNSGGGSGSRGGGSGRGAHR